MQYKFHLINLMIKVLIRGIIFQDRDYGDKILVEGEDIEMIKKHEQEKMAAMKEDELQIEDEMEAVWVLPYLPRRLVCWNTIPLKYCGKLRLTCCKKEIKYNRILIINNNKLNLQR